MTISNTPHTTHQDAAREAAIVQNLPMVKTLARRLRARVPACVTIDDLVSAGTIGLIQAVDHFDESRGLKFTSYARHRVWGAMLDFLRAEDPLSRDQRRRHRESATTVPVTISLDQVSVPAANRILRTEERVVDNLALASEMRAARGGLTERENRVIAMLFDLGWKNCRVAAHLKVNESRVSQIKQRSLTKLARAINAAHFRGTA